MKYKYYILFFILFFYLSINSFGQSSKGKTLYVADSVPITSQPSYDNELLPEVIDHITVIKNRDSLNNLGIKNLDSAIYVYTKAYVNRPDSIKKIPSLIQMKNKDSLWYFRNELYSGKYINYFINGNKEYEGTMHNGKINGIVKVYYYNGKLLSEQTFTDGEADGFKIDYYKNGQIRRRAEFKKGRYSDGIDENYFPNGQIESKCFSNKESSIDTCVYYYSTGKTNHISFRKKGKMIFDPVMDKINYWNLKSYESFRQADYKQVEKYSDKILKLDSMRADAYFKKGESLYWQYRFDEAIEIFDKALKIEPLMSIALAGRGLARMKKYQFSGTEKLTKTQKIGLFYSWYAPPLPKDEQEKVCSDLQLAVELNINNTTSGNIIEAIRTYCKNKN